MGRRVCILGMGASGKYRSVDIKRHVAGCTEVMTLNNGYLCYPSLTSDRLWTRYYELHQYGYLKVWADAPQPKGSGSQRYFQDLEALGCPVYSMEHLPVVNNQRLLPLLDICMQYNSNYFLGSPNLMLMHLLYEHDMGQEIEELRTFGIDQSDTQHAQQRVAWAWWLRAFHDRRVALTGTSTDFMCEPEMDRGLDGLRKLIGQAMAERVGQNEKIDPNKIPPVIVAGFPHSGTHHMAYALQKARIRLRHGNIEMPEGECTAMRQMVIRELGRHGIVGNKAIPERLLADGDVALEPTREFVGELSAYRKAREAQGTVWGFVQPYAVLLLDAFLEVFPEACFIFAMRNPVSVGESWFKAFDCDSPQDGMSAYLIALGHLYRSKCEATFWNVDGNQRKEQEQLGEIIGLPLDLVTGWKGESG